MINKGNLIKYKADCENCFGLCCVALPFIKSVDFAVDKDGGAPCKNLQSDFRCGIHEDLRGKGYKGCTVYECFGAGQKVSQFTYKGKDWRENKSTAKEMFHVFPIMQQLHEMLYYLQEAVNLVETRSIHSEIQKVLDETVALTKLNPVSLMNLNVSNHRALVNELLLKTSELVRLKVKKDKNLQKKVGKGMDLIGAKLKGANLKGMSWRGTFLIAADLRESDLRYCDFIGSDLRDANLHGANLQGSIFLTQAQVNATEGDKYTKLPSHLNVPKHWLT
jgi:uncharacterized protein YjbI with pentapeptide repeats